MPTTQIVKKALIALGSNVGSTAGSPLETAKSGIQAVRDAGWQVDSVSRFFRTPAFPAGSGPDFVNAAFAVDLPPEAAPGGLLDALHRIEADFGRQRTERWASRTLDLDLLAVGDIVLPDAQTAAHWIDLPLEAQQAAAPDELILPHPRLQERAFVLVPLADIAPGWRHPVLGRTVAEMLAAQPGADVASVIPL